MRWRWPTSATNTSEAIPHARPCERHARVIARESPDSAHVDVDDLDGVVSVAESVPGWDLGLGVAGGVRRAGAERVAADVVGVPIERPVLPLVGPGGRLEPSRVPVAFAGEADVDLSDRTGSRPRLAAHRVRSAVEQRAVCGRGNAGADPHE